MKLKKGDKIKMIRGKDLGKTGIITRTFPKDDTILVDDMNTYKKNRKPKKQGEKGQIVVLSRPFVCSKAMLICPKCGKPTRVGFIIEINKDGKKVKTRTCKKCNAKI
jgi:large subunit ribosomal protein L24